MVVKYNENLKALITFFFCFEMLDILFCITASFDSLHFLGKLV